MLTGVSVRMSHTVGQDLTVHQSQDDALVRAAESELERGCRLWTPGSRHSICCVTPRSPRRGWRGHSDHKAMSAAALLAVCVAQHNRVSARHRPSCLEGRGGGTLWV